MKIVSANRIAPEWMPRFAASHLGLLCLPMSHKKDARLIWVKDFYDDALTELVNHYANRTLIVSCTKD